MKRRYVCLQLGFEARKDFNLAMASRRAALSGNALLITTFSSLNNFIRLHFTYYIRRQTVVTIQTQGKGV